jgi:hypothetical protein
MTLELVRSLFPRWNFFDRISYRLELEVKQTGAKDWLPISFNASRRMGGLFVNPELTRLHAEMSLLESFVNDIQSLIEPDGLIDSARVQNLTSFKMVRALVFNKLMVSSTDEIQFRVAARSGDEQVVIYSSDVLSGVLSGTSSVSEEVT